MRCSGGAQGASEIRDRAKWWCWDDIFVRWSGHICFVLFSLLRIMSVLIRNVSQSLLFFDALSKYMLPLVFYCGTLSTQTCRVAWQPHISEVHSNMPCNVFHLNHAGRPLPEACENWEWCSKRTSLDFPLRSGAAGSDNGSNGEQYRWESWDNGCGPAFRGFSRLHNFGSQGTEMAGESDWEELTHENKQTKKECCSDKPCLRYFSISKMKDSNNGDPVTPLYNVRVFVLDRFTNLLFEPFYYTLPFLL